MFYGVMILGTVLVTLAMPAAYFTWQAFTAPFPHIPLRVLGDFPLVQDKEIGFVGRSDGRTHWIDPRSGLDFHIYTDKRRARIDRPGQPRPNKITIMTIGGSFAFGYGVENEQTFTSILGRTPGIGAVDNLAYPSYGTVQTLQAWQRNRDLHPRYVIYAIIEDHLRRNISPCAPTLTPYCLPVAHVVFDAAGTPSIAPPSLERSMPADMRQRFLRNVVFQDHIGLDDVIWKARMDLHRIATLGAFPYKDTPKRRELAASFLLEKLATDVSATGARLLVVYIPQTNRRGTLAPPSEALRAALAGKPLSFLDLTPAMIRYRQDANRPPLFIPNNWHPSAAGHRLIAKMILKTWFADLQDDAPARQSTR